MSSNWESVGVRDCKDRLESEGKLRFVNRMTLVVC